MDSSIEWEARQSSTTRSLRNAQPQLCAHENGLSPGKFTKREAFLQTTGVTYNSLKEAHKLIFQMDVSGDVLLLRQPYPRRTIGRNKAVSTACTVSGRAFWIPIGDRPPPFWRGERQVPVRSASALGARPAF